MADERNDAPREKRFVLARQEQRVLEWIARRLPARVMPDHLSALGLFAAAGIAAAYMPELPIFAFDLGGLVIATAMVGALVVRAARNLGTLAEREPAGRVSAAP